MKNPENKKYILQETRDLKNNEFVYRRGKGECACKDASFWQHMANEYNCYHEIIDDINLPDDSKGERMWGIRIKNYAWDTKEEEKEDEDSTT